jgi:hypothetical protein
VIIVVRLFNPLSPLLSVVDALSSPVVVKVSPTHLLYAWMMGWVPQQISALSNDPNDKLFFVVTVRSRCQPTLLPWVVVHLIPILRWSTACRIVPPYLIQTTSESAVVVLSAARD